MAGFDGGNTNWNPRGVRLVDDPECVTSVEYFGPTSLDPGAGVPRAPPGTVVVDGPTLYFAHDNEVTAYDFEKGSVRWRREIGSHSERISPEQRRPPSIADDELYIDPEGTVYGINRSSGDVRWRCHVFEGDPEQHTHSRPRHGVVVTEQFVYDVVGGTLYAVDRRSGAVAWRFDRAQLERRPLVDDDIVVVHGTESVVGLDPIAGTTAWETARAFVPEGGSAQIQNKTQESSTLLSGGTVVTTDGPGVYALSGETGRVRWNVSLSVPVQGLAATDERLVVAGRQEHWSDSSEGRTYELACFSMADGRQRWQIGVDIPGEINANTNVRVGRPLITGDTVLVDSGWTPPVLATDGGIPYEHDPPGGGTLRAFDLETGEQRWYCPLGEPAAFKSATRTRAYIGGLGGAIHAFEDSGTKTVVYDPESRRESVSIHASGAACPGCGSSLDDHDDPAYCPDCGRAL
jgi:outer membrane protein assembly factor BamB